MGARIGTILIVEDFVDDAKALQIVLAQAGISNPFEVVHSVSDAIAYLTYISCRQDSPQHPPVNVILLDLKLPGQNGFQLLEWLQERREFGHTLVMVVSGLDDLASIRRAYALGADSFLAKPCTPQDVENIVRSFPEYWERAFTVPLASLLEALHAHGEPHSR